MWVFEINVEQGVLAYIYWLICQKYIYSGEKEVCVSIEGFVKSINFVSK